MINASTTSYLFFLISSFWIISCISSTVIWSFMVFSNTPFRCCMNLSTSSFENLPTLLNAFITAFSIFEKLYSCIESSRLMTCSLVGFILDMCYIFLFFLFFVYIIYIIVNSFTLFMHLTNYIFKNRVLNYKNICI